jgi:hypothetical protein
VAYDQWTQFEDFPRVVSGVEQVDQMDGPHLHRVATIAGRGPPGSEFVHVLAGRLERSMG